MFLPITIVLVILLSPFLRIWNQHKTLGFLTSHENLVELVKRNILNILQKVDSRVYQKPTKNSVKPEDEVLPQDEEDKV
jgi:hypothetical protein